MYKKNKKNSFFLLNLGKKPLTRDFLAFLDSGIEDQSWCKL